MNNQAEKFRFSSILGSFLWLSLAFNQIIGCSIILSLMSSFSESLHLLYSCSVILYFFSLLNYSLSSKYFLTKVFYNNEFAFGREVGSLFNSCFKRSFASSGISRIESSNLRSDQVINLKVWFSSSPKNGETKQNSSYKMIPRQYTSIECEYFSFFIISGEIYSIVPQKVSLWVA